MGKIARAISIILLLSVILSLTPLYAMAIENDELVDVEENVQLIEQEEYAEELEAEEQLPTEQEAELSFVEEDLQPAPQLRPDSYIRNGINFQTIFNFEFYIGLHADLSAIFYNNPNAALNHFVNHGMREGRMASENFDVFSYKNANQDLRLVFGNDLRAYFIHFINHGQREGRVATGVYTVQNPITVLDGVNFALVYDFETYQQLNPDVAGVFGNDDIATLRHFVNHGMREGRQGIATFDVHSYRNANPDLRSVFGNNLRAFFIHYINHGHREGRVAAGVDVRQGGITVLNGIDYSLVYDFEFYRDRYADLRVAFGDDDVAMLNHFVNHGMRGGRVAHPNFNVHSFRSANLELQHVFGYNLPLYYYYRMGMWDQAFRHPMISVAMSQIGNVGGETFWRWWGWGTRVPWCAIFVSWVAERNNYISAGVIPRFQSCAVGIRWFRERGQWRSPSHRPNTGDLIFFDWTGSGAADHVGIVVRVLGNYVHVIEGNAADAVRWRTYNLNDRTIFGYATPRY